MNAVSAVRKLYFDGARRWPKIKLSFDAFEAHCHRVFDLEQGDEIAREAADLYLCCACIAADREALRCFESEGLEVARAAISRVNRESDFVQEVLQDVWDKLLLGPRAKVKQYTGRGPLKGWIRVAATRAALDRCRSRGLRARREVELSERLAGYDPNQSPELFAIKARYGPAFQQAIRSAVAALAAQDRNVLRMHVVGRCSIDEIGRAYNVHRATAARWLDRSRVAIHDAVRRELCCDSYKLTESEFKSLAHLLGGELELHLTTHSRQYETLAAHG